MLRRGSGLRWKLELGARKGERRDSSNWKVVKCCGLALSYKTVLSSHCSRWRSKWNFVQYLGFFVSAYFAETKTALMKGNLII